MSDFRQDRPAAIDNRHMMNMSLKRVGFILVSGFNEHTSPTNKSRKVVDACKPAGGNAAYQYICGGCIWRQCKVILTKCIFFLSK
jgi:hypothetical protein